jgi:hypothetical protein
MGGPAGLGASLEVWGPDGGALAQTEGVGRPRKPSNQSVGGKADDIYARCQKEFWALSHAIKTRGAKFKDYELTELTTAAGGCAVLVSAIGMEISRLPPADNKSADAHQRRDRVVTLCRDLAVAMAGLEALMARQTGRLQPQWEVTLAITIALIVAALAAVSVLVFCFPVSPLLIAAGSAGAAVLAAMPTVAHLVRTKQSLHVESMEALAHGRAVLQETREWIGWTDEDHEAFLMSKTLALLASTVPSRKLQVSNIKVLSKRLPVGKVAMLRLTSKATAVRVEEPLTDEQRRLGGGEVIAKAWRTFKSRTDAKYKSIPADDGAPSERVRLRYTGRDGGRVYYVPGDMPASPNGPPRVITRFEDARDGEEVGEGGFNKVVSAPRNFVTRYQREDRRVLPLQYNPKDLEDLPSFLPSFQLEPGIQGARWGGIDLYKWSDDGKNRLPLSAFREASADLARLHEKGLYHRDIKPENMTLCMVGGKPQVFFIDCDFMVKPSKVKEELKPQGTREYLSHSVMNMDQKQYRDSLRRGDELAFFLVMLALNAGLMPRLRPGGHYDPEYMMDMRMDWVRRKMGQHEKTMSKFLREPLTTSFELGCLDKMIDWTHPGGDSLLPRQQW